MYLVIYYQSYQICKWSFDQIIFLYISRHVLIFHLSRRDKTFDFVCKSKFDVNLFERWHTRRHLFYNRWSMFLKLSGKQPRNTDPFSKNDIIWLLKLLTAVKLFTNVRILQSKKFFSFRRLITSLYCSIKFRRLSSTIPRYVNLFTYSRFLLFILSLCNIVESLFLLSKIIALVMSALSVKVLKLHHL